MEPLFTNSAAVKARAAILHNETLLWTGRQLLASHWILPGSVLLLVVTTFLPLLDRKIPIPGWIPMLAAAAALVSLIHILRTPVAFLTDHRVLLKHPVIAGPREKETLDLADIVGIRVRAPGLHNLLMETSHVLLIARGNRRLVLRSLAGNDELVDQLTRLGVLRAPSPDDEEAGRPELTLPTVDPASTPT